MSDESETGETGAVTPPKMLNGFLLVRKTGMQRQMTEAGLVVDGGKQGMSCGEVRAVSAPWYEDGARRETSVTVGETVWFDERNVAGVFGYDRALCLLVHESTLRMATSGIPETPRLIVTSQMPPTVQ